MGDRDTGVLPVSLDHVQDAHATDDVVNTVTQGQRRLHLRGAFRAEPFPYLPYFTYFPLLPSALAVNTVRPGARRRAGY